MFSKFIEWLNTLDDEKFFMVGRQERIRQLRRTRVIQLLVVFGMMLMGIFFIKADQNIFRWGAALFLIGFGISDAQIKILLLSEKIRPEG